MSYDNTAEADKDTSSWKTEVETLKQQLAEQSAICDFVKKDSQLGRYGHYFTVLRYTST